MIFGKVPSRLIGVWLDLIERDKSGHFDLLPK